MFRGPFRSVEIRGKKEAGYFWYADCGVTSVSNGIIAHNDMIKDNPELVRNFVKASIRGFVYARQNPDEAAAIVKKYSESLVPEIIKREMELSWATWNTPNTKGKPLGWMSDADWAATVDVIKQYGGVSNLDAKSSIRMTLLRMTPHLSSLNFTNALSLLEDGTNGGSHPER